MLAGAEMDAHLAMRLLRQAGAEEEAQVAAAPFIGDGQAENAGQGIDVHLVAALIQQRDQGRGQRLLRRGFIQPDQEAAASFFLVEQQRGLSPAQ